MREKSEKLFEAVGRVDDGLIEDALDGAVRKKKRRLRWTGPVAAVLAAAVLCGVLFWRGGTAGYALRLASYPRDGKRVDRRFDYEAYAPALGSYLTASIPALLSGEEGENRVCSPLNVYMALSMLAETTAGDTRAQILSLLGAETIEDVRARAELLWRGNYLDAKSGKCVLANSIWLDKDVSCEKETLKRLSEDFFASSFRGRMGSEAYSAALRSWLDKQTGGLLGEKTENVSLSGDMLLALASTVYFRGKWVHEFAKSATDTAAFHTASGDVQCAFMHKTTEAPYYWGEAFGAAALIFYEGSSMWFILPDEGVTPEALLGSEELADFLSADRLARAEWENQKRMKIHLSVPKFDVSCEQALPDALRALGVTYAFDPQRADFSPLTDSGGVFVSQASHSARVTIDEEGCVAAAYTAMTVGAAPPPDEEIDFTLDRPFLFAITGPDGLPLFAGIVNQP